MDVRFRVPADRDRAFRRWTVDERRDRPPDVIGRVDSRTGVPTTINRCGPDLHSVTRVELHAASSKIAVDTRFRSNRRFQTRRRIYGGPRQCFLGHRLKTRLETSGVVIVDAVAAAAAADHTRNSRLLSTDRKARVEPELSLVHEDRKIAVQQ